MGNFTPKELTWLGLAKELVWGTAVVPLYYIPFKDAKPVDVIDYVKDEGVRGALAKTFNVMPGVIHSTFDIDGQTYPDSIGLMLLAMLGSDTPTGTGPYIHSFKLARTAQPPSLTVSYYDGTSERQFAGSVAEQLDFKWASNAALEYTYKLQGMPSAVITTGTPTPTATIPFMSWQFTATVGGSAKLNVVGFDITVKRDKLYVQHAANNTASPTAIIATAVSITGKVTFDKMDDSELTAYLTNTQPALTLVGAQGTNGITFQVTKCAFIKDTISGKEVVQGDVEFEGIDNTTDGGPGLIKLTNAVATY